MVQKIWYLRIGSHRSMEVIGIWRPEVKTQFVIFPLEAQCQGHCLPRDSVGELGHHVASETRVNGQLMKKDNIKKTFLWEKQYGEGKYNKTPTCPVWHVIWRVM